MYFMVTYPDAALTKPIIASYEYVGTEELTNEGGNLTTQYLFKYMPVFRSTETVDLADGYICYPAERLQDMNDIDGLLRELTEVSHKLKPHV